MEKYEPLKQIKNIKTGYPKVKKPKVNYKQIYFDAFGIDADDHTTFVPSEISGEKGVDLHHVIGRGKMGENRIENLMSLTRSEHIELGDKKEYMAMLLKIHRAFLRNNGVPFSEEYFNEKLAIYDKD